MKRFRFISVLPLEIEERIDGEWIKYKDHKSEKTKWFEWRDVNNELPPIYSDGMSEHVMICIGEFNYVTVGYLSFGGKWTEDGVTHWMPKPKGPTSNISQQDKRRVMKDGNV